jgi:hypothetical protein
VQIGRWATFDDDLFVPNDATSEIENDQNAGNV